MVLVDDDDSFLHDLETQALKRSSNLKIFQEIRKKFKECLSREEVVEKIKKELGKKFKSQPKIDTSVSKLRIKYKWLKDQWKKYNDRIKSGSGKSSIKEPDWFKTLDPVFLETHAELPVATKGDDIDSDDEHGSQPSSENDLTTDHALSTTISSEASFLDESHERDGGSTQQYLKQMRVFHRPQVR